MNFEFEYTKVDNADEVQKLGEILSQCFNADIKKWEIYRNRINIDDLRVLRRGKDIVGGLVIYSMAQWISEKSIPMGGIAGVGIAPEYRGSGAAFTLMSQAVKELYQQDIPLSTLYPATQRLYRKIGYEQAGNYCQWEISLSDICLNSHELLIEKIPNPQPQLFIDLYKQQASKINGYLDRNLTIWKTILDDNEGKIYAYWVGEKNNRQGYIIFQQKMIEGELYLVIKDWIALNHLAMKRLWTFIQDHSSQVKKCLWYGGINQAKLLLIPEQKAKILSHFIWFSRIINVVKALELRPYPNHLETELNLTITDELIPSNTDNFKLEISRGKGKVIQGGKGEIKLNVKELAPLYTGFLTPQELLDLGKLEANEKVIKRATEIFLLSTPALADFF
ncbi:hypothetical protein GM3708_3184 [Geminocystis sp. NIES-3708]|uniref:GNAT family N-acetyltransferase n=1 Tax=Geminocystis sp. NIES-3708 TaxID=1615909 RepID=UPI0005FC5A07|nr:GNAT family N-acetyltransferase [Geminocystis sp. NIES-3708]BAQ62778.1 hypothetical protein GM3708_3184 [Geminocystis sp. NIES-3708]